MRREFIERFIVLTASAGCLDVASADQSGASACIAVLPQLMNKGEAEAFRKGLREFGYVEGRDIFVEWHTSPGDTNRLTDVIQDVVQRKVDVIVVTTTFAAQAAKRATSTIPIVIASSADPVGAGLVKDLAHPGANITGFSLMETDLHAKRLELLKEALPSVSRVAVLWNPGMPSHPAAVERLKAAAPGLGIAVHFTAVRTADQLDPTFDTIVKAHAQALYVLQDQLFTSLVPRIIKLAQKARIPIFHANKYVAEVGGLISYGPDLGDLFRRSAGYVDKILKGTKPGDLPIEQPTKFELAVNLKTAKALGITIPNSILLRADEVIR